jgi:RNA polymerase sigma factor (sigma-70 family)
VPAARCAIEADTQDVGQKVWLQLVDQIASLRDPAALPGWLAATTRRECLRALKEQRLHARLADLLQSANDAVIGEELLTGRNTALRAAFAELPPRSQQLLFMLISDPPHSYAEISQKLQIPVGSIGPQRDRYLARLRAFIARHESGTRANIQGGEPGRHSWTEAG